jgi:hypothetical protein
MVRLTPVALLVVVAACAGPDDADIDSSSDHLTQKAAQRCDERDNAERHYRDGGWLEDNDSIGSAYQLQSVDDEAAFDAFVDTHYDNNLWDGDVDWYRFHAKDVSAAALEPTVLVAPRGFTDRWGGGPVEWRLELCVYALGDVQCEFGTRSATEHPEAGTLEGCCGAPTTFAMVRRSALAATLGVDAVSSDDSTELFVSVAPGPDFNPEDCLPYRMRWSGSDFLQ